MSGKVTLLRKAAMMRANGATIVQTARAVSRSPRTITRWEQTPQYQAMMVEYQAKHQTEAEDRLAAWTERVMDAAFADVLGDDAYKPGVYRIMLAILQRSWALDDREHMMRLADEAAGGNLDAMVEFLANAKQMAKGDTE